MIDCGRAKRIRELLEADGETKVVDLHLWSVAPLHEAVVVSLVTHAPREPDEYKLRLSSLDHLEHVTIEVNSCCPPADASSGSQSARSAGSGGVRHRDDADMS